MGGLTCDIGRGFNRSLEHRFISPSKLVVKLHYGKPAILLHFIQISAKCDKNEQNCVFCSYYDLMYPNQVQRSQKMHLASQFRSFGLKVPPH